MPKSSDGKRASHGAHSKELQTRGAQIQKRRLLRQLGVVQADLSPIGVAYLDSWARVKTKLVLLDRWLESRAPGLVNEAGEAPAFMSFYVSLVNSERQALAKLEAHLQAREERGKPSKLQDWIEATLTEEDEDGG